MAEKIVPLSREYTAHGTTFKEVALRAPKHADYRQLGKVIERQRDVVITYPETIWLYADRLIVRPEASMIADLDLIDSIAIEEAIIGFFTDAMKLLSEQTTSSSS